MNNYTQRLQMQREITRRATFQARIIANDPQAHYRVLSYAKAIRAHVQALHLELAQGDRLDVEACLSVQACAELEKLLAPVETLLTSIAEAPPAR